MKKMNSGFTLIELVVVIVILGILAVTAIPRFVDLTNEAELAAVQGVAGSLASGSAVNYATRSITTAKGSATAGQTCTAVATALLVSVPAGYSFSGTVGTTVGATTGCGITGPNGQVATAQVIAAN